MMYNADFLIAAVVILLLVLRNFLDQKRAEDLNSRVFLFFAVIGILDVIAELVSNYYITSVKGLVSTILASKIVARPASSIFFTEISLLSCNVII